ncbi:MAG: LptA/OstA family protein [Pseudomonadota bacterium]
MIKKFGLVFGLMAMMAAGPAAAQLSNDGGPIRVKADRSEVLDKEKKVVLIDNVDIAQADARLRANIVTLAYSGDGEGGSGGIASSFGDIRTMTAQGEVFYINPELKANGDLGVYDAQTGIITLTGNVILVRGEDVARGDRLTMNLSNGTTSLDGAVNMVIIPTEETNP